MVRAPDQYFGGCEQISLSSCLVFCLCVCRKPTLLLFENILVLNNNFTKKGKHLSCDVIFNVNNILFKYKVHLNTTEISYIQYNTFEKDTEISLRYILGQDDMSRARMDAPPCCPFQLSPFIEL